MPPRTNCSQPSYSEGNASGRQLRVRDDRAALAREAASDLEGVAADVADQSTLHRLLSLTPNLKLIVRDVTHASRRVGDCETRQEDGGGGRVVNVRAAQHRHESKAKPRERCVLNLVLANGPPDSR